MGGNVGGMKGGGGTPQQQGSGYGPKGGGGMPQGQMPPPPQGMPPGGMPPGGAPPQMNPQMMQQMQQMMAQRQQMMGREGMRPPGMEGGINSLQRMPPPPPGGMPPQFGGGPPPPPPGGGAPMFLGDQGTGTPNTMPPPPAAATGASPGGPLSGRNFNQGFGGQRGFGMGRFGGYRGGRFGGGMPGMGDMPTPAGAYTGVASLPQGYATGGKVSWSPAATTSSGMFTNMSALPAITAPATYVRPAQSTPVWQPPAAAAPVAKAAPRYLGLNPSYSGQYNGGGIDPRTGRPYYTGGSGSHGGGRG
jgi:hypothetical protein